MILTRPKAQLFRRISAALVFTATPVLQLSAQTVTANFNTLTDPSGSVRYVQNCYAESGLRFTVVGDACGVMDSFATWGPADAGFYSGSPALFNNSATGTAVDITTVSGATFNLLSMSLTAFLGSAGNPTTVLFQGTRSVGGAVSQSFSLAGLSNTPILATLNGFTSLSSVRLTVTVPSFEPYVQFDNVTATIGAVAVVPEPTTMLLTAMGLAVVGAAFRQRARQSAQ